MKTILVAGGAGFIGSHLVDALVAAGHRVWVADNLITGDVKNLSHSRARLIQTDIRVPWQQWLKEQEAGEVDQIYNLASPASPVDFARMPEFILTTAALGHRNLLGLGAWIQKNRQKACPVLLTSTSEVYGDPLVHPQPESYWGNVNCIGERGCYDEAKRFAEALSMAYRREHQLPAKIVRIFNTYGPRMRPSDGRVLCNFISQALRGEPMTVYGDGSQTRSFCYVTDMVRGLIALMESEHLGPVNIGNPGEFTVMDVAKTVASLLEIDLKLDFQALPADDPKRRRPDIALAQGLLNWKPEVDLRHGLTQMIEDVKKQLSVL